MAVEQLTDNPEEQVTVVLSKEDAALFRSFMGALRLANGWCRVNRWIFKCVLIAGFTAIILLSDTIDGLKNILHSLGKH